MQLSEKKKKEVRGVGTQTWCSLSWAFFFCSWRIHLSQQKIAQVRQILWTVSQFPSFYGAKLHCTTSPDLKLDLVNALWSCRGQVQAFRQMCSASPQNFTSKLRFCSQAVAEMNIEPFSDPDVTASLLVRWFDWTAFCFTLHQYTQLDRPLTISYRHKISGQLSFFFFFP